MAHQLGTLAACDQVVPDIFFPSLHRGFDILQIFISDLLPHGGSDYDTLEGLFTEKVLKEPGALPFLPAETMGCDGMQINEPVELIRSLQISMVSQPLGDVFEYLHIGSAVVVEARGVDQENWAIDLW